MFYCTLEIFYAQSLSQKKKKKNARRTKFFTLCKQGLKLNIEKKLTEQRLALNVSKMTEHQLISAKSLRYQNGVFKAHR